MHAIHNTTQTHTHTHTHTHIRKNVCVCARARDTELNIQPKTYEYKDVINRETKRVYVFISQQIAEIVPKNSFNSKRDII